MIMLFYFGAKIHNKNVMLNSSLVVSCKSKSVSIWFGLVCVLYDFCCFDLYNILILSQRMACPSTHQMNIHNYNQ